MQASQHPGSICRRPPEPLPTQATTYVPPSRHGQIHQLALGFLPPTSQNHQPSGSPSVVRTTAQPTFCATCEPRPFNPAPTRLPPPVTRSYHQVQRPSILDRDRPMFLAKKDLIIDFLFTNEELFMHRITHGCFAGLSIGVGTPK